MSLYRQYRPKTFADVIGQDHVVTTLTQAVAQGKLAHAYLFSGSRGTGKTSVARILAKAMLTQGMNDDVVKKQIDEGVDEGSIVDLVEIDAASNRGIDDIRGLVEKIQFSPVAAAAKVYIIDEVHMLTREAFNALLKTLEEPPPYAYFILATTELQKIPATIQSRCQRFSFRHVGEDDLVSRLQFIADQEGIQAERDALRAIARHAQGGMRDAISLLDQLRSLPKISETDVKERLGESGQDYAEPVLKALEEKNGQAVLALIRQAEASGISLENLARHLLASLRQSLHAGIDAGEPVSMQAHLLSLLLTAMRDMRLSPVPGLVLEAALLSLCAAGEKEEEQPKRGFFGRKKQEKAPAAEPEPLPEIKQIEPIAKAEPEAKTAIIEAPDLTLASVKAAWLDILKNVTPASVRMSLKNGRVHSLEGLTLQISFTSTFHKEKVAHTDASRSVEEVLQKTFKRPLRIQCIVEEEGKGTAADGSMVNLAEAAAEVF